MPKALRMGRPAKGLCFTVARTAVFILLILLSILQALVLQQTSQTSALPESYCVLSINSASLSHKYRHGAQLSSDPHSIP